MVKYIYKDSSSSLKIFGHITYIISIGFVTVELFISQDRMKYTVKKSSLLLCFYSLVCHNTSNLVLLKIFLNLYNILYLRLMNFP